MSRSSAANRISKQQGADKMTNKAKRRETAQRRKQNKRQAREESKGFRSNPAT